MQHVCHREHCAGDSASMQKVIRASGWELASISKERWQQLATLTQQQDFLRSKLPLCGL